MSTLTLEPVSYKKQIKDNELLCKLRIIRLVKNTEHTQLETAEKFQCHRNTVGNIIRSFEQQLEEQTQRQLLNRSLTEDQIQTLLEPIKNRPRSPDSHSRSASPEQQRKVAEIFERLKVGPYRMQTLLRRKYEQAEDDFLRSLSELTLGQLKGIYQRESLQPEKKRSTTGKTVPLYDYRSLACFERLHYDVKEITDQDTLPQAVYDKFKGSQLPTYEFNIIDAKSRFRFLSYSNHHYSEFGLRFLLLVTQYIRAKTNNWDIDIRVGADNGTEFCLGSEAKERRWNEYLTPLNASFYSYNGKKDPRKNLIERSHKTDDYEFFVPRGEFIHTKADFLKEAAQYAVYFNAQRPHSGRAMQDRTPLEVLQDSKVIGAKKLLEFPCLMLEDRIELLRKHTDWLIFVQRVNELLEQQSSETIDRKQLIDLERKFNFFNGQNAQNVLTYYRTEPRA